MYVCERGHVFGETGEVETVRRESSVFFSQLVCPC